MQNQPQLQKNNQKQESNKAPDKSYYVNGRGQIIEMLKLLTFSERNRILAHIKLKNPSLAVELAEDSLGFDNLTDLKNDSWRILLNSLNPQVLGVAIKSLDKTSQRKILSLAPDRHFAETAYNAMLMKLPQERHDIGRAQSRVIQTLNRLLKERKITLI